MALETTNNRVEYSGNGVTTVFSFPNYFLEEADLKVIIRSALGVETLKTLTTHYTVAGEGEEAGGTVTMLSAPAAGESLIIYRDPAILQDKDFVENDSFPAEQAEEAFDRAAMISQRLSDRLDRKVGLSDGFVADFDLTLPADLDDAANKIPLINEDGDGFADAADWPDIDGVTAGMEASAAAAAASAAAALASEGAAATSASAASTSASGAATSASAASTSASAASTSASAAAASATAAANTLASALWRGVLRKTFADSPYTVSSSDNGKLIVVDTTGGAVVINLPSVAAITLPFTLGIQLDAGTNAITVNRNGTDTIDGATSKSITVLGSGAQFLADSTPAPDEWEVLDFGAQSGNLAADVFSGTGAQTAFTLSVDPGSKNNTFVYVEGIYQAKVTYSVSGTTLTFTEAPPSGTSNVEVVIGTTLAIGVPSDATITKAKFAGGAPKVTVTASKTTTYVATSADDIIPCNATSGAFTVTLPAATSNAGMQLQIKKTDSTINAVTVDGNSTETIDGALTFTLSKQYQAVTIVCDGTGWHVIDFFAAAELITIASSIKTPSATGQYQSLSNNSMVLTPGTWELTGYGFFDNNGSSPVYSTVGVAWKGANGADSASIPVTVASLSNITVLSATEAQMIHIGLARADIDYGYLVPTVIVKTTAAVTIYLDTFYAGTTAANARISVYGTAKRIA